VHLLDQLGEPAGREPAGEPGFVPTEVEGRGPDEEGIGTEAVERGEPALGRAEPGREGVDIGSVRCHQPPAEYADASHLAGDASWTPAGCRERRAASPRRR